MSMTGTDFFALMTACLKTPSKKDKINIIRYLYSLPDTGINNRSDAEKLAKSLLRIPVKEITFSADEAEKTLEMCRCEGIRVVSYFNSEYPPLLREIYSPPSVLLCERNSS